MSAIPQKMNENIKSNNTANSKKLVSFNKESQVRFFSEQSLQIGTPLQHGMSDEAKVTAGKLRNSTPHVSKLQLDQLDSENSLRGFENKKKTWAEIQASILRTSRALEHEKRSQTPLTIFSVGKPLLYVPADNIPASVRKFMASRAKRPALKAVRSLSQDMTVQKVPSPLKLDIQREGAKLNARRTALMERLEDFGLDSSRYNLWPVSELEQRVAALEEEGRRAGVEALLVEYGHDPKEFLEFSSEEIEAWLEKEMTRQARASASDLRMTPFQGSRISFASELSFVSAGPECEATSENAEPLGAEIVPEVEIASATEVASDAVQETSTSAQIVETQANNGVDSILEQMSQMVIEADSAAAKTIKVVVPKPDPMEMTCEQIRSELKARGLKVSGLKSVIAERLAQAYADEIEEEEMFTEGHEFIGKTVVRHFTSGSCKGTVKAFLPPVEGESMNSARFHIVHEDGDAEVLDYDETKEVVEEAMKETQ